jgi:hypothetical protein
MTPAQNLTAAQYLAVLRRVRETLQNRCPTLIAAVVAPTTVDEVRQQCVDCTIVLANDLGTVSGTLYWSEEECTDPWDATVTLRMKGEFSMMIPVLEFLQKSRTPRAEV